MRGIDLYEGAGRVDWRAVRASGLDFAIIKATEGATIRDARFREHWPQIRRAGMLRGAYHVFYAASSTPEAQADAFLATIGTLRPGDLPPALDIEEVSIQHTDAEDVIERARAWLRRVERRLRAQTGKDIRPIIYTNPITWMELGNPHAFIDHPLWIASPGAGDPSIPVPFGEHDWLIRQSHFNQPSAGTAGLVDINVDQGVAVGARGSLVRDIQRRLGMHGADGDFGAQTDAAVRAFQRRRGLDVDGIVGLRTWVELIWS